MNVAGDRTRRGGEGGGGLVPEFSRLASAQRDRRVRSASPTEYGNALAFPQVTFTVDAIEVQAESFTAPAGSYEWSIIAKNTGTIDTVLVFAECGGGSASETAPASRLFAIDDKSWTLLGGNVLTFAMQPASYEAEEPFDVNVSVWAKQLASVTTA